MSIFQGSGSSDPSQIWFGNNAVREVWVGSNRLWPVGPQSDANFWFDFNDTSALLKNRGTSRFVMGTRGSLYPDHDHAWFVTDGRINFNPPNGWADGYSVSMWTREILANSGWKTILHRAPSTGTLTNEAYVVFNTSSSSTTIASGMKFGSTHREFSSNYSVPIATDWFHTVVVWRRTSSTAYTCTFYINGVQRGSFSATGYASNTQFSGDQIYVGGNRSFGEWSGRLDDFVLWSRPISAAEVTEVYNQGRSWIPQILSYGPFDFVVNESGGVFLAADFTPTSWSATGLPQGITLGNNGYLSGTVTATGSGTMVVTATDGTNTATKSFSWTATEVSNLPNHSIMTSGANKVSHNGWARPALTWKLVNDGGGAFSANGTLVNPRGRGRIRFVATLTNGRNTRIVSDQRGVLATGSGTNQNYRTDVLVTNLDEGFYIEVENYSSTTSDSFLLATDQP